MGEYIEVICIKNDHGNSNFTLGHTYTIKKNKNRFFGNYIMTCDFIHIFLKDIGGYHISDFKYKVCDVVKIAFCEFRVICYSIPL